ncbi:SH3 domain-containing protein [Geopyxis carbonaria]|nr:SH3 domain-containing protein [Geopyxis carbonaria]
MPSLFLGVYTVIYDYTAQNEKELSLHEGDVLCVLDKPTDDDWWKAKKKGNSVDDEEPIGLVPNNYIEQAQPIGKYKSLYGYVQQTEEEISFEEDVVLDAYDLSDPDWALVGFGDSYGFAPTIYMEKIELSTGSNTASSGSKEVTHEQEDHKELPTPSDLPPVYAVPQQAPRRKTSIESSGSPRANLETSSPKFPPRKDDRGSSGKKSGHNNESSISIQQHPTVYSDSDQSDGQTLPQRRPGQPPYRHSDNRTSDPPIPPGFWTYPVQEVDSKKKRAATLGLGTTGIILLPDKSSRPKEEWSVDNLISYNYEGKHVFLEFEKPSRSLDLHAGSTNTAEEIVAALGDMRGARKASGLQEVIAAASGSKQSDIGTVLFDFPAQGQDEVSVTRGDEVIILDDTNHDWWLVRRQVNGNEGVVPRKYVERGRKNLKVGIMESPRLPNDTQKSQGRQNDMGPSDVPERRSSLPPQGRKSVSSKSKPDHAHIRTWTDRLGKFEVDAQFLGYRDDKIHLHKINGVKIAVPVSKMSMKDIKYVEDKTGISLEDQKPLSEIMKRKRPQAGIVVDRPSNQASPSLGISSSISSPRKNEYDWFEFFLNCGVDVNDCQRYTINFQKDNMDESILADITPEIMRTLGMKEGDILRVNKKLEQKHEVRDSAGGLFSEPNGNLKNKATRSRPVPTIQTGTAVDPKAFSTNDADVTHQPEPTKSPAPIGTSNVGFEDDAWAPKPSKQISPSEASGKSTTAVVPTVSNSDALKDLSSLSLSSPPLQPNVATPSPTMSASTNSPPTQPLSFVPPSQPAILPRPRPAPPPVTNPGNLSIAPPPARPLSAPQTFVSPLQSISPSITGIQGYLPATTLGSQPIIPAHTGINGPIPMISGMAYHNVGVPYLSNNYLPIAQASNPTMTGSMFQPSVQPISATMAVPGLPISQFPMSQSISSTTGRSSFLPAPLVPQPTSVISPALQPQPTGPPPSVRFGVQGQKKLTPQPTGRANLSKATPDNPFGF